MTDLSQRALLSEATAAIWQTAADPKHWIEAMRAVGRMMPECRGGLTVTPFAEGAGHIWETIDAPDGFMADYLEKWHGHDTTLHALARRLPAEQVLFNHADLMPDGSRCGIWQNLYIPYGINAMTGLVVHGAVGGGGEALLFSSFCDHWDEREDSRRKATLLTLAPHLNGAAALHWRLVQAESKSASVKSILDRLALGIVALNRTGAAIEANRAAQRYLNAEGGLAFNRGRILAHNRQTQVMIDAAIAAVLSGGAERPISIAREGGGPLTIIVAPSIVDASDALGSGTRALVFISDPDLVPENAGSRVAALYGLTRSEAEIAQGIASGKDVSEIASARGTSTSTTRTQIKSLMSKIGASRQSDVVRALLAVSVLDAR